MKVFTATFISENYGSLLQAYALQCKLKELGASPVIIELPLREEAVNSVRKFASKLKFILKPEKHYGIVKRSRRVIEPLIFKGRKEKTDRFIKNELAIKSYIDCVNQMKSEKCILLAGSDQVWNTLNAPISGFYLFDYAEASHCKKYSYAASIGLSNLDETQKEYYANALKDFSVVSFREKAAYDLLKDYLLNPIVRYDLDPTLLYRADFWKSFSANRICAKPYVFVYMLRPDKKLITMARKVAKENKYQVVYLGQFNNLYTGVKTLFSAGVEEFISAIYNAEMIITNSFHCTVFSTLFGKRFVSVKIESTNSRVENLLNIVDLQEHLISGIDELEIIYDRYDVLKVDEKLEAERSKSINYLSGLLQKAIY